MLRCPLSCLIALALSVCASCTSPVGIWAAVGVRGIGSVGTEYVTRPEMPTHKDRFCATCDKKTPQRKIPGSTRVGCRHCFLVPPPLTRGKRECPGLSCAEILSTKAVKCPDCGWVKDWGILTKRRCALPWVLSRCPSLNAAHSNTWQTRAVLAPFTARCAHSESCPCALLPG
jgi:hypothetical protein